MPYALVHAGSKLWKVDPGGNAVEVALPAGVTISSTRRARWAVLNQRVIMVHAPSVNLQIDGNLVVRILSPRTPTSTVTAATGGAGSLTGNYQYKVAFAIMEGTTVVAESGLSDASGIVSPAAQEVDLSAIPVSSDPGVNARRIYRTTDGPGDSYFLVTTIQNNSDTTYTDDATDEAISIFPAEESLGNPPGTTDADYFEVISVWRDRLWAASNLNADRAYYSGNRIQYGWRSSQFVIAQPTGEDLEGITAFAPRRDELGVGKRRSLWKVIGDTPLRYQMIRVDANIGIWAAESVVVIRDAAYFLAEDGVYRWDGNGVKSMSRDTVHAWFTEDDTFNRALFANAFAHYNQQYDQYELFLPAAGSTDFDRWVALDLGTGQWYGPHLTAAFTPSCASVLEDESGLLYPVIGGDDGLIYQQNQAAFTDNGSAIAMLLEMAPHTMGDPDITKFWGELTMYTKREAAGTLTIKRQTGDLDALSGPVSVSSMTRAGSTVTVITATSHDFGNGAAITIAGANEADYNGVWTITRVDGTTFTFDIGAAVPATPATGTITALLPIRGDITIPLTADRTRTKRLGVGRVTQLTFSNSENNQGCEIRGYEVNPVEVLGRR